MAVRFCTLFSGSSGNCTYIENNDSAILIDVGGSARKILASLQSINSDISKVKGIFITHEHTDHICGLKAITNKYKIPIIANNNTLRAIWSTYPDIDSSLFMELHTGDKACAGDFEVTSFFTPHDSAESVGYKVDTGNVKITVATDMGHITDAFLKSALESEIVLIEANYDEMMLKNGVYPIFLKKRVLSQNGHLSNDECGRACVELVKAGTKRILLAHLSKENNTPQIALKTVTRVLLEQNIQPERDVYLEAMPRFDCSKIYCV